MSVKKVIKKVKVPNRNIWREKATVVADLGCGENKRPGSIGVDFREAPGVDVVQNLSLYPWKNIPSGVANENNRVFVHATIDSGIRARTLLGFYQFNGDTFTGLYVMNLGGFSDIQIAKWLKVAGVVFQRMSIKNT